MSADGWRALAARAWRRLARLETKYDRRIVIALLVAVAMIAWRIGVEMM